MTSRRDRLLHLCALASLLALIVLGLACELWLAPLRPGGSWLALKVLPLCLAVPGVLRRRNYTLQWSALLILLYFIEGSVRATSDRGPAALLGAVETGLVLVYFGCVLAWLFPRKRAARLARKAGGTAAPTAESTTAPTAAPSVPHPQDVRSHTPP